MLVTAYKSGAPLYHGRLKMKLESVLTIFHYIKFSLPASECCQQLSILGLSRSLSCRVLSSKMLGCSSQLNRQQIVQYSRFDEWV